MIKKILGHVFNHLYAPTANGSYKGADDNRLRLDYIQPEIGGGEPPINMSATENFVVVVAPAMQCGYPFLVDSIGNSMPMIDEKSRTYAMKQLTLGNPLLVNNGSAIPLSMTDNLITGLQKTG